jgi:hypothetical protein
VVLRHVVQTGMHLKNWPQVLAGHLLPWWRLCRRPWGWIPVVVKGLSA